MYESQALCHSNVGKVRRILLSWLIFTSLSYFYEDIFQWEKMEPRTVLRSNFKCLKNSTLTRPIIPVHICCVHFITAPFSPCLWWRHITRILMAQIVCSNHRVVDIFQALLHCLHSALGRDFNLLTLYDSIKPLNDGIVLNSKAWKVKDWFVNLRGYTLRPELNRSTGDFLLSLIYAQNRLELYQLHLFTASETH